MVLKLDEDKLAREQIGDGSTVAPERGGGVRTLSRLNFLRVGVVGGMTLLGWRLWDMQKPLQESFSTETVKKTTTIDTRLITYTAPRGLVYDRTGKTKLISNKVTYAVTITANYLPDPSTGKNDNEIKEIRKQRQEVYDNLARFLGMRYYIGLIPEQVNGVRKANGFTNPERNSILNELETLTSTAARDWDKRLTKLADDDADKQLLVVNDKEGYSTELFDRYAYLRTKFKTGIFFLSEGERKMLEAKFYTPEYQPVVVWPDLPREDAMLLEEKRLEFPGVGVQMSYQRQYADPRLYAHILGYTGSFRNQEQLDKFNKEVAPEINPNNPQDPSSKIKPYAIDDKIGLTGIEGAMEKFLRGRKAAKEVSVSSTGHILDVLGVSDAPLPGYSVVLSLDTALQEQVAKSLEKWIDEALRNSRKPKQVKEGAAVVSDVNTGEVLAMVAFPYYNNNLYTLPLNKWKPEEIKEMEDEVKAVQVSRAIDARYAPGSTFKLITAAAALNEKKITPYTTFVCDKFISVPTTSNTEQKFRCWGKHGTMDIRSAIEQSCDIYFYNAAVPDETSEFYGRSRYYQPNSKIPAYFQGLGINLLNGYMKLFGMGEKTGLEIESEYKGTLPGPHTKLWSIGETMTTAIGQGDVEMTPLQINMITAAFANGGKLLRPKLVRQIKDPDGKEIEGLQPKVIRDVTKDKVPWTIVNPDDNTKTITTDFVLTPGVLQLVREGMLQVTGPQGTANREMSGKMGRLKVAGKTGTAEYGEVIGKDKDNNDARATRAWFTAFAPYDNPEIAVTVMIDSGDIGNEGSTYAVPAVKEILEYKFPTLVNKK